MAQFDIRNIFPPEVLASLGYAVGGPAGAAVAGGFDTLLGTGDGGDDKGEMFASVLSGILGGAAGALGGGSKGGGPSKRQIDESNTLRRQNQNNQHLQMLAQILLRNSGRGGF